MSQNWRTQSTDDKARWVRRYLEASAETKRDVARACSLDIISAATLISKCLADGGKVMLCGNGGSAADCQHMAAELVSRVTMDFARPGLAAVALTTDTSILTAYANDFDFEGVFARQVQALARPGDVLIGISTSGGSRNVIRAVEAARRQDTSVVTLTGEGGELRKMADVGIRVPSESTQLIQESHLAIEHIICHLVERDVCPPETD